MAGCGSSTIKIFLFIFNVLFMLGGIALVVIGSITLAQIGTLEATAQSSIFAACITLIIVGCILFLIAFLGCCGSVRESYCLLITFACFIFLLLIITLTIGILVFVYKGKYDNLIKTGLEELRTHYGENTEQGEVATKTWDTLQESLHCCGVNSALDWGGSPPASCKCTLSSEHCGVDLIYTRGCYKPVLKNSQQMTSYLGTFAIVAIVFATILLLGGICACIFASSVKQKKSWDV